MTRPVWRARLPKIKFRASRRRLSGQVAAALMARAPELFEVAPDIAPIDVLAAKLPSS